MNFPDLSKCKIAIIGLGYVGLPLAIEFATQKKCLRNNSKLKREVIGFDINHERIKELQKGIDKTKEISGEKLLDINNLFFTNDQSKLISADVFIVTVPTPIDIEKNPELSALKAASNTVGIAIKERYLSNISTLPIVIFESTVFPSATQEICQPIIAAQSGCNLYPEISDTGSFGIGYSPERINPGDKKRPLTKITKVTSGSCEKVADWIDELYGSIIESGTFKANSIMVAEASKIIENTQRDLNIALINELAIIFSKLGIDTLDVIKTASTKWNFLPFKPGLVGGHCIGVDPYYLTYKAKMSGYYPDVILSGRRINDGMGFWLVENFILKMAKSKTIIGNSKILIMGFSFKEDCPDIRNTRVKDIYSALIDYGTKPTIYDPNVNSNEAKKNYKIEVENILKTGIKYEGIIVAVAHQCFIEMKINDWKNLMKENTLILDIKGIVPRVLNPIRI